MKIILATTEQMAYMHSSVRYPIVYNDNFYRRGYDTARFNSMVVVCTKVPGYKNSCYIDVRKFGIDFKKWYKALHPPK